MKAKNLAAKVACMALISIVPLATLSSGASAAQKPIGGVETRAITANRIAPNAWSSRVSGLPTGGAALFDGVPLYGGSIFYDSPAAPAAAHHLAPNAWSSRLSGLQEGGAALFV